MGAVAAVPCCGGVGDVSAEARSESDGEITSRDGDNLAATTVTPRGEASGIVEVVDGNELAGGEAGLDCGAVAERRGKLLAEHTDESMHGSESTTDTPRPVVAEGPPAASDRSIAAKRPSEVFLATFDRRGDSKDLGLELVGGARGRTLVVKRITTGLARDHNSSKKHPPIRVGDHVYEINGVKDQAMAMMDQFRTAAKLELVYGRPAK